MTHKEIVPFIEHKAYNLRRWSIMMTSRAGSGHPTSCLSAADIVTTLFFYAMRYDPYNYENPDNDRFILSKGHAAPLLYSAWHELDLVTDEELLTYREIDSSLEGHPTRRFTYTEAATGSLGIGLSIGVGEALCAKLDKRSYRTYVLMGDSESSEGSVWEAMQLASYYKLDNLVAFIDCNNLGQSTEPMLDYNIKQYVKRCTAFGWETFSVNGHDIPELISVLDKAQTIKNKPVMIIAKTIKGYGVDFAAAAPHMHGKAFKGEQEKEALNDLQKNFPQAAQYNDNHDWHPPKPTQSHLTPTPQCTIITLPQSDYKKGDMIATRKAYGQSLALLGDICDTVVSLDAEVKNSTFAELFEDIRPTRFFQCFVAEQNMISMGVGFERRNKIPFISTFAAFFSRAYDQIRMATIGDSALRLVGSHCGVSIGQDGPSQMGLEDIAIMRCLTNSVVLYPSDAVSTHKLVEQMARYDKGISYLRTTRMETSVLYDNNEEFPIGGCKVVKKPQNNTKACIIGAGVTLYEALKAHDILEKKNISISVIDLYSIKPIDTQTISATAKQSSNTIITVEDHYPEGGIGEAVLDALRSTTITVYSLAVNRMPRSGKPEELLAFESIDAHSIVAKIEEIV